MYDIYPIEMVEQTVTSGTSTTKTTVFDSLEKINEEIVNNEGE